VKNEAKMKELEAKLGDRSKASLLSYSNRNDLRAWVMAAGGCDYKKASTASLASLKNIYGDATGTLLARFLANEAPAPVTKEEAAPVGALGIEEAALAVENAGTAQKVNEILTGADKAAELFAQALALLSKGAGIDETKVEAIAKRVMSESIQPKVVVLDKRAGEVKKDLGVQHFLFELLLKAVSTRTPVALVGEAGSGKTTGAERVAEALSLEFTMNSFCRMTTKSDLLGFIDANGNYRGTQFRDAFENGKVYIGDEFDAGNENVAVVLSAALANGSCAFPDKVVKRHENFVPIICMNTFGRGGDRQFVGRNQMDAATMDRFAIIEWNIDEALEASILGVAKPQNKFNLDAGGTATAEKWLERVSSVRAGVAKAAVRHIVSPRASIYGVRMLQAGIGKAHVEEMVLWKGLDKEQRARIEKEAR
jgi:MoxR-like ATPase